MKKAYRDPIGMKEDPLGFLLKLTGYKLAKNVHKYRLYCSIIAMCSALFDILPIYRGLFTGNENRSCLIGVFMHLPSLVGILLGGVYSSDLVKYEETLRTSCLPIESQGLKVKEKILTECRIIKTFCLCLCCYSSLVHLSFLYFYEAKCSFMCQFTWMKQLLGKFHGFGIFPFALLLAIDGVLLITLLLDPAHAVFHLRFQYLLLNAYAEDLKRSRADLYAIDDIEYQNYIHHKLTLCVKHHLRIKGIFDSLLPQLQDIPMFLASFTGLPAFVISVYFIITDVSPENNFRMILVIILGIAIFLAICFCGQLLCEESIKFHNLLCNSQWPDWNTKNRNSLLIILPNTARPLKISCFGLYDLDYRYILYGIRVAYSLLAVAEKLRA